MSQTVAWKTYPIGSSPYLPVETLDLSGFTTLYLARSPSRFTLKVDPFGEFELASKDAVSARNEAIEVFMAAADRLIAALYSSCALADSAKITPQKKEINDGVRNDIRRHT